MEEGRVAVSELPPLINANEACLRSHDEPRRRERGGREGGKGREAKERHGGVEEGENRVRTECRGGREEEEKWGGETRRGTAVY